MTPLYLQLLQLLGRQQPPPAAAPAAVQPRAMPQQQQMPSGGLDMPNYNLPYWFQAVQNLHKQSQSAAQQPRKPTGDPNSGSGPVSPTMPPGQPGTTGVLPPNPQLAFPGSY